MTRSEHLQWCKDRALEYVDAGDIPQAFASMCSDLNKHEGTEGHSGMELGMVMLMAGRIETPAEARKFINEFN